MGDKHRYSRRDGEGQRSSSYTPLVDPPPPPTYDSSPPSRSRADYTAPSVPLGQVFTAMWAELMYIIGLKRRHTFHCISLFIYATDSAIQQERVVPIFNDLENVVRRLQPGNGLQLQVCIPDQVQQESVYTRYAKPITEQVHKVRANPERTGRLDSGVSLSTLFKDGIAVTRKNQRESSFKYHLVVLADGREVFTDQGLAEFRKLRPWGIQWSLDIVGVVVPSGDKNQEQRAREFLKGIGARVYKAKKVPKLPFVRKYEHVGYQDPY